MEFIFLNVVKQKSQMWDEILVHARIERGNKMTELNRKDYLEQG